MTDHHTSSRSRGSRPVIRDLRFAGTVAAGLCAGVLGVGAIAAPLVGWDKLPSALTSGGEHTLTVDRPAIPSSQTSRESRGRPGSGTPATIGVVGPVAVPGTVLATTPGGVLGGSPAPADAPASRSASTRTSDAGKATPGGTGNGQTGFVTPKDSDGDGIPDVYESANGMNPAVDDAAADDDGDGIPNNVEYQLR